MIETVLGQNKQLPTLSGPGAARIQVTAFSVSGNLETGHPILKPGYAGQLLTVLAPGPCVFEFYNTITPQIEGLDDNNRLEFSGSGYAHFVAQMCPDGNGPEVLGWWLLDYAGCVVTFG